MCLNPLEKEMKRGETSLETLRRTREIWCSRVKTRPVFVPQSLKIERRDGVSRTLTPVGRPFYPSLFLLLHMTPKEGERSPDSRVKGQEIGLSV